MAPMLVTLNDFAGHSPVAGLLKCNPSNILQYFTRFQLTVCSRGPSATAGFLVHFGDVGFVCWLIRCSEALVMSGGYFLACPGITSRLTLILLSFVWLTPTFLKRKLLVDLSTTRYDICSLLMCCTCYDVIVVFITKLNKWAQQLLEILTPHYHSFHLILHWSENSLAHWKQYQEVSVQLSVNQQFLED